MQRQTVRSQSFILHYYKAKNDNNNTAQEKLHIDLPINGMRRNDDPLKTGDGTKKKSEGVL